MFTEHLAGLTNKEREKMLGGRRDEAGTQRAGPGGSLES